MGRGDEMKKENCYGCYNDEYNHGLGGAKECFSFSSAKLVKKLAVDVNQMPPFDLKKIKEYPSCYHQQRAAHIEPSRLTDEGYWK